MESGIYKITNPEGKSYVGFTKDLKQRETHYKNLNCPSQRLVYESIINHGWDNHIFDIIEYTSEDLDVREVYWIEHLNTYNDGLNLNKGGGGPKTHTQETRDKISKIGKSNKGKRANSHRKGKTLSKEHCLNMSLGSKGKPSHRKGKTIPDEVKMKISKTKKGKPIPGNRKPVLQYSKEGEFIAEHISIEHAALAVKGNPSAISNTLREGGGSTSSSYIWLYKNK